MSTTNPKMSVKRLQVYSWAVLFTFADERYVWAPLLIFFIFWRDFGVYFVFVPYLVCPMLLVAVDYLFSIASSVIPDVYVVLNTLRL
jgi:hypothetical protein